MSQYLEERSSDVQEVMNTMPNKVIRWGITSIAVFFGLILLITNLVRFPDVIVEKITLAKTTQALKAPLHDITPASNLIAEMSIAQKDLLNFQPGDDVRLSFDAYPSVIYGLLTGKVHQVAEVANEDSRFDVKILLPQSATTTKQKAIDYKIGLVGEGKVILEDKTLFDRIINF